jgi:phosphatidylglycerol---prolipoprotein diacylglyceryl transferase
MYANLYYVLKDWFGVKWSALSFVNTFGAFVALGFIVAAALLSAELRRREQLKLLIPKEEVVIFGKPATIAELVVNGIIGFVLGFKLLGVFLHRPADVDAREYIFSKNGFWIGGIICAALFVYLKYREASKNKLATPEKRTVRIWPHERVGDIVVLGLIFGILGAKLFDAFENMSALLADPIKVIFSGSGLAFYGGLIVAALAICWYAVKKRIKLIHLLDSAGPALILAYAIGRMGCQVSGDGDWGRYNTAYTLDTATNKVVLAKSPADFENVKKQYASYFLYGNIPGTNDSNGRRADSLSAVSSMYLKGPSFLPTWLFAYTYPKNVNADGIVITNDTDVHNRQLPHPVVPTSLYEIIFCTLAFLLLWAIRKKVTIAGVMFSIYLILNGLERFLIEQIRVNDQYNAGGVNLSQAQFIAICLMVAGVLFGLYCIIKRKQAQ